MREIKGGSKECPVKPNQRCVQWNTFYKCHHWPLTKHRTLTEFLQLGKWLLSSLRTLCTCLRSCMTHLLPMCNDWTQFRSIECRCVGALLGQFKACNEFDPFWPWTLLIQLQKHLICINRDGTAKVISAVEKKCKCHIGILGKDAKSEPALTIVRPAHLLKIL